MGWVWFALVVAAAALTAGLARMLWRKVRGLGRELARAGDLGARLSEQGEHLPRRPTGPTMLADDLQLRARVARRKARRKLRKQARDRRHRQTWDRWLQRSE